MTRACLMLAITSAILISGCIEQPTPEAEKADLRTTIPVEIGKAYYRSGTRIPVKIMNLTGKDQPYILIECGLYLNGTLIETAQRIWNDVPAGETAVGDLLPDATKADRVDCRPSIR